MGDKFLDEPSSLVLDDDAPFGTMSSSIGDILRTRPPQPAAAPDAPDLEILRKLVNEAVAQLMKPSAPAAAVAVDGVQELLKRREPLEQAKREVEQDMAKMTAAARAAERELRADFQASLDFLRNWENLKTALMKQNLANVTADLEKISELEKNACNLAPESFNAAVEEQLSKPLLTSIRVNIDDTPFEARARKEALRRALVLESLLEGRDRVIFDLTRDLQGADEELADVRNHSMMSSRPLSHNIGDDAWKRVHAALTKRGVDLRSALSLFDEDCDGLLSRLQFAEALKAVAPALSDAEVDGLLMKCDPRGFGELRVAEIVQKLSS